MAAQAVCGSCQSTSRFLAKQFSEACTLLGRKLSQLLREALDHQASFVFVLAGASIGASFRTRVCKFLRGNGLASGIFLPYKQGVTGSSPVSPTNYDKGLRKHREPFPFGLVRMLVRRLTDSKGEDGGLR